MLNDDERRAWRGIEARLQGDQPRWSPVFAPGREQRSRRCQVMVGVLLGFGLAVVGAAAGPAVAMLAAVLALVVIGALRWPSRTPSPLPARDSDPGTVVVGVNGHRCSARALDWAVSEAARNSLALRVVHARSPTARTDLADCAMPLPTAHPNDRGHPDDRGEALLRWARARARRIAPHLSTSTHVVDDDPTTAILAQPATLIVLGGCRRNSVSRTLRGSIATSVRARADCPVVTVPSSNPLARRRRVSAPTPNLTPDPTSAEPPITSVTARTPAPVVVGVDGSEPARAAIGYALRVAAERDTTLIAVHAWTPRGPVDVGGFADDRLAGESRARDTLAEALARWHGWYPDVEVTTDLACTDPTEALVAHSHTATLLVLGSRGRRGAPALFTRSIRNRFYRHVNCAVAVITVRL